MERITGGFEDPKAQSPIDEGSSPSGLSDENSDKEQVRLNSSTLEISHIPEEDVLRPLLLPFQELEKTVWEKDVCSGYRACISICPAGTLAYDNVQNRPYQVTSCVDCKACTEVCPRMPFNNRDVEPFQILGQYLAIKNARSVKSNTRSQKGGAATALLTAALNEELIDCALVMGLDPWSQKPYRRIVYDAKELKKCAGSKYTSNAILEPLKDILKGAKNIALVGTPCSIQAMGLMRRSSNEFAARVAQKVRFIVGLFCFEAYEDSLIPDISGIIGMPTWRFDGMNISEGKINIRLRDGNHGVIPLGDLAEHIKPGCKGCADFTAKLSDVSIGSIGSSPGMSTVIIRTAEGMGLFNIAEEMGFLEVVDSVNVDLIEKAGKLKLAKNGF